MAIRAVVFDLGNTLVSYYESRGFPTVLRRCLQECTTALGGAANEPVSDELFERAMALNQERPDFAVRPLHQRLGELFGAVQLSGGVSVAALSTAFMTPIFELARRDPVATDVLDRLRGAGIKTAIVSNTPWGSPADLWRNELIRHGLLARVDAAVFCMDVGWRKPHRAPFERALSLLGVAPSDALFLGDDRRWDVVGARNAGIRPVLLGQNHSDECATIERLDDIVALATKSPESGGAA